MANELDEEKKLAKENAAAQPAPHEPGPVPEGAVFTVHAYSGTTRDVGQELKAFKTLLGPVTHDVALERCKQANETTPDDVWFGVVSFDAEKNDPRPATAALPDPKTPSKPPTDPGFGKVAGS